MGPLRYFFIELLLFYEFINPETGVVGTGSATATGTATGPISDSEHDQANLIGRLRIALQIALQIKLKMSISDEAIITRRKFCIEINENSLVC